MLPILCLIKEKRGAETPIYRISCLRIQPSCKFREGDKLSPPPIHIYGW